MSAFFCHVDKLLYVAYRIKKTEVVMWNLRLNGPRGQVLGRPLITQVNLYKGPGMRGGGRGGV